MNRKVIAGLTLTLFLIITLFDTVPVVLASASAMPRSSPVLPASGEWDVQTLWNFCRFVLQSRLQLQPPDEKVKVAVVSENLTQWDEIHENMTNPDIYPNPDVLGQYANVTYSARVSVNETDFSDVFGNVSTSGARLLIHLFSTQAGINFTKQWKESGVKAVPVGINVEAQNMSFWEETEGKCEYETVLASSSVVQWQKSPVTGEAGLAVVWPRDQVYSKKWRIPPWIYSLAETDLDYNGIVYLSDLLIFAYAYGTRPGYPRWNLECDIDGNFIINVVDLCRLAKDWYKTAGFGASLGTASFIPKIAQTNSETLVYLDPPTINATAIGQEFTVNINISDAVEIYGWQAGLTFNSTLLNCTNFIQGEFLQSGGKSTLWEAGSINNTAGVITPFSCTLLYENVNASGSGQLAYLRFKAKAPGVSDLHLRDVMVMNSSNIYKMVPFNIIDTYTVARSAAQTAVTVSNSTGQELEYGSGFYGHAFSRPDKQISFNVTGPYPGFSNVTIPKTLINVSTPDLLLVIIDDVPLKTEERTVTENLTHYFVYFNYTLGIHNIRILKRPPVCNINTNLYYATIQKAINSAQSGHKILAYAGIHYEHVVVNKSVTLIGENKHNTTIDGSLIGTVINVTANNVHISGFTIQKSGNPECGILVEGSSGNNISNNIITNNYYGVRLVNSNNNALDGNNASNNEYGILLDSSSNNTLTNNIMSGNKYNFGLYGTIGTHFNNTIDLTNTVEGKPVYYVKKASNTVYDPSTNAGTFYLVDCINITIRNLTLTKNVNGIFLWNTTNSKIRNVTASNNLNGIYLHSSNSNVIYHNSFIGNTIQAKVIESYSNLWDNGYPSGGNYWSEYIDTDYYRGPYQNETGNDGILDHKYIINANNVDSYPLVSPLTPPVYNLNTHLGYTKIQEAINSANSGHTIFARAGTYHENVTINKSLTLIGIIGSTVINGTGTVFTITANNVTLRGFTIKGSGSTDKGIFVSHANNVVISENTITKKGYGIWLNYSENCRISGNTINNNTEEGIHLEYSGSAIISRNTITNNSYGIVLTNSNGNDIHRNNIKDNDWGISLFQSNGNMIYHNNFVNNTNQKYLYGSPNNTWDDSAGRGNYWSDYTGVDDGSNNRTADDGVGDTLLPHQGVDWYPLMNPRTPQHDVAVVSVTPSKTVVGRGYSVKITVTIENQGDYVETFNFNLSNPMETRIIILTSESSITIIFTWNTTGVSCGDYTISANATIVPGETDTTDNTKDCTIKVTIPGDVNGDPLRKVTWEDLGLLGLAYGSKPGDPNWNPNADINSSGKVTWEDLGILGLNYGKSC